MDEESLAVAMKALMKARDAEVKEVRQSHEKEKAALKSDFTDVIRKRDKEWFQMLKYAFIQSRATSITPV